MKIKAQIAMVMNLDKCLGCHTCSITCKNTWTNREGAEYIWFNNVETKPGTGYPTEWENQKRYRGGWTGRKGELQLRAGHSLERLALQLFHNPHLPSLDDYYEPWTYDYEKLTHRGAGRYQPTARPKSLITGKPMEIKHGPNWEDDLAGGPEAGRKDPNLAAMESSVRLEFEHAFQVNLPRICEHCLNPACVASCPSGAIYKREEDGIVLVDQETCRGWRMCMSGCPYKKVYFNWTWKKAEKCIFCFPRVEAGLPTICSETCTGRLRYIGVLLYDADKVAAMAAIEDPRQLYEAQLAIFLDPADPETIAQCKRDGIADDWIEAAQNSSVHALIATYRVALPLHPEFRTLPMVWYIPPLSPISQAAMKSGGEGQMLPALDQMRIPIQYLANLLTAGDKKPVRLALQRMIALRLVQRARSLGQPVDPSHLESAGMDMESLEALYQLLALAKYEQRFVIPTSKTETVGNSYERQGCTGFEAGRPGGGCGR